MLLSSADSVALLDSALVRASRELLEELRADDRVCDIEVTIVRIGQSSQTVTRARATLKNGEVCQTHMFSASDAIWALALDHRLRAGVVPRFPRRAHAS